MAIVRRLLKLESTMSPKEQQKALEEFFKNYPYVVKDFEVTMPAIKNDGGMDDDDEVIEVKHIVFVEVPSSYVPGEPRRRRRL